MAGQLVRLDACGRALVGDTAKRLIVGAVRGVGLADGGNESLGSTASRLPNSLVMQLSAEPLDIHSPFIAALITVTQSQ